MWHFATASLCLNLRSRALIKKISHDSLYLPKLSILALHIPAAFHVILLCKVEIRLGSGKARLTVRKNIQVARRFAGEIWCTVSFPSFISNSDSTVGSWKTSVRLDRNHSARHCVRGLKQLQTKKIALSPDLYTLLPRLRFISMVRQLCCGVSCG